MSKPLDRLTLLHTFVRVAESGSISAAARDLGLSQPTASRQLAELERRLNSQLMRRTTHSLSLTDTGTDLLNEARDLLQGWESLEEKYADGNSQLRGKLKVVVPVALGQLHLIRIMSQFVLANPAIELSWLLQDSPIKFAETGCDCWVKIGAVPDDNLIVKPLGTIERLLVAAASFSDSAGTLNKPVDANALPALALDAFEVGQIPLANKLGKTERIAPPVRLTTNNLFALKEAAIQGVGMAVLPKWFIRNELESGVLVDLLPEWRAPALRLNLAYLPARKQPKRLRALLDVISREMTAHTGIIAN